MMNADFAKAAISNPMARQMAANQASQYASQSAAGLRGFVEEENVLSLRVLSFFMGLAIFILSLISLFSFLSSFGEPFDYLMNFYFLMFGFAIVYQNSKDSWPGVESARTWIGNNFGIMNSNFGRGSMYIFLGSLWWVSASNPITKFSVGACLFGLGTLYVITGLVLPCIRGRQQQQQNDLEMQSTAIPIGRAK